MSSVGGRCAVLDICTRVDVNVTRVILTVINCGPYGVCFIAIDGLKARDMRSCKSRRVSHTVIMVGSGLGSTLIHQEC